MREIKWQEGSIAENWEEIKEFAAGFWPQTVQARCFGVPFKLYDGFFYDAEASGYVGVLLGRSPNNGALVGIYLTLLVPYIYSPEYTQSEEVAWFIHKRYMTKTHLKQFLRAVEQANKNWGADFLSISLHDIGDVDSGKQLMESEGYRMTNLHFMKGV